MTIDRLIGILAVLLREGQVTAGSLADRFEVSVRTIQRDIDRLCRAGIPLRTARGGRRRRRGTTAWSLIWPPGTAPSWPPGWRR